MNPGVFPISAGTAVSREKWGKHFFYTAGKEGGKHGTVESLVAGGACGAG